VNFEHVSSAILFCSISSKFHVTGSSSSHPLFIHVPFIPFVTVVPGSLLVPSVLPSVIIGVCGTSCIKLHQVAKPQTAAEYYTSLVSSFLPHLSLFTPLLSPLFIFCSTSYLPFLSLFHVWHFQNYSNACICRRCILSNHLDNQTSHAQSQYQMLLALVKTKDTSNVHEATRNLQGQGILF
jgi:hypothetical protein